MRCCSYVASRIINNSLMTTARIDRSSRRAKSLVSNQQPRFIIRRPAGVNKPAIKHGH